VLDALESLGWSVSENLGRTISARVGISFWSWGERITVTFLREGSLRVTSSCASPTQCFDWGKNKKNVIMLIAEIRKVERLIVIKEKITIADPHAAVDPTGNGGNQDIQESKDRIKYGEP
jgi:hypothetical protein